MWRLGIGYKDSYTIDEVEELIRSGAIENVLKHQSQKLKYPYHVFYEALSYLKNKGFDRIHKVNEDYLGILAEYSEENFENSLLFFFENFASTYECMIENNFPSLKKELSLFGEADLVVISHAKEKGADSPTRLWIESIRSSSVTVETQQIIIRKKTEYDENTYLREFLNPERNHLIEYGGSYYEPTFGYSTGMGELILETPMMDFIYDIIRIKIRNYLTLISPL